MDDRDDGAFASMCLKALPTTPASPALEARLMADFDRLALAQGGRLSSALHWAERMWPGVPLWQPLSALALSLLIGLAAGTLVPATNQSPSTDQSFAVADTSSVMDLYKDL